MSVAEYERVSVFVLVIEGNVAETLTDDVALPDKELLSLGLELTETELLSENVRVTDAVAVTVGDELLLSDVVTVLDDERVTEPLTDPVALLVPVTLGVAVIVAVAVPVPLLLAV